MESSQAYASRRTAFWQSVWTRARSPASLMQLLAWRRRKTKLKREGLLGRRCQSCHKDRAGGGTRRVPRAFLGTLWLTEDVTQTHTLTNSLQQHYMKGNTMSQLPPHFWAPSMTGTFPSWGFWKDFPPSLSFLYARTQRHIGSDADASIAAWDTKPSLTLAGLVVSH